MPVASVFGGDFGANIAIGNKGVSGKELAGIFGNIAQAKAQEQAQERARANRTLKITGVSLIAFVLIATLLVLYFKTPSPHSPNP